MSIQVESLGSRLGEETLEVADAGRGRGGWSHHGNLGIPNLGMEDSGVTRNHLREGVGGMAREILPGKVVDR